MQKISKIKIGKETHLFAFSGETIWDAVRESDKHMFSEIPKCGKCGGDNLDLRAFYPKDEFKYLKVVCRDCKASLTFGSPKKNPEVYYPRRDKEDSSFIWETYEKKE